MNQYPELLTDKVKEAVNNWILKSTISISPNKSKKNIQPKKI